MKTVQPLVDRQSPYYTFCREERNLAALMYTALLRPANLSRFLSAVLHRPISTEDVAQAEVYYEYAFLRDFWHRHHRDASLAEKNKLKREFIINGLAQAPDVVATISEMSIQQLNTFFGAVPYASATEIQMPGKWSLARFSRNIQNPNDLLTVCKFKWAFNIKPDIVVIYNDQAICIEAKMESIEGSYPSKDIEKKVFQEHGLKYVLQTEMQKYLFEQVLHKQNTDYVFLVRDRLVSQSHQQLTWAQAFSMVDMDGMLPFAQAWGNQIQKAADVSI